MADGNHSPNVSSGAGNGDPNSPNVSSGAGNGDPNSFCVSIGGGGSGGSTNPANLGDPDRYESIRNGSRGNPPRADRYRSGSRGSGDLHGNVYTSLHIGGGGGSGGSGSGYLHGNVYLDWHGRGGGSSAYMSIGSSSSNNRGSGDPRALANGYANWHGSRESSNNLRYGHPNLYGSGSGSRAVDQRTPGHVSYGSYNNGYDGAAVSWPSFNGMHAPQQAPTNNLYAADAVPPFVPNGGRSPPPQQPGLQEFNVDFLIGDQLRSLTIGNSYIDRRNTMAGLGNGRQQGRRIAGEQSNTLPANVRRRADAANPYRHARLEDVRGRVPRFARDLHGCQFLRRMVDERGADAVRDMFDEVAGEVVRLMGNRVSAALVDDMASLWTDEQVACVLRTLAASSPQEVMEAAVNYTGSNVLQKLICRIEGRRDQIEAFMRCLAGVGERNVLALIKDQAGGRVIQKCLETFSPEHNLFIFRVVMWSPNDVAYNQHGCHTMKRCIDNSIDAQTRDFLVRAVCKDGLALAQDDFGNYVVQHVIRAVAPGAPWAMERLHAEFRGRYVSLSQQKAGSNVVQQCLEFFPQVYSDQIVLELVLNPVFHELIHDPYANYVLQSAISRTEGPLLRLLADSVRPYRDILRDNMHARKVLQMLFPTRRTFC